MKANDLKKNLGSLTDELRRTYDHVNVKVKKPIVGASSVEIIIEEIADDIACSADVERALRKEYGLGQFEKMYDADKSIMSVTFKPLPVDKNLLSSTSTYHKQSFYSRSEDTSCRSDAPGVVVR